jgi:NADP-dependent 3-hydroxy acid dehydrogenase YdfG
MNAQALTDQIDASAAKLCSRMPSSRMPSLRGKVAVVTGASAGIGRAIALGLAEEGARVWLVGRNAGALEDVAKAARETATEVHVCRADWTRDEELRVVADDVRSSGRADVLVLCGGEIHHGEHANASVADLDAQYRANVRGPYLLMQALLPALQSACGQVVFVNSSTGLVARVRSGQFAATQHGMKAIADSLRAEVNEQGIRVLSVFLGRTATARTEILFREEGKTYRPELLMQPEDVALMVVQALKMPRTAEVTEISMRPLLKSY